MTPDKLLYLMDEMIKIDGEDLMRVKPSTAPLEALLAFNSRRLARTTDMLCLTIAFVADQAKKQ
jgi:hypothetical protein